MMETKVWFALCALLLVNIGQAEQNVPASTSKAPVTGAADHVSVSSVDPTSHPVKALNLSSATPSFSSNSSLNGTTTAPEKTTSLKPEAKNQNDTNISPSLAPNITSTTGNSTAQSPVPSSENSTTTSETLPTTRPPHTADNTSKDTTNATISNKPTKNETLSSTSAPANTSIPAATNSTQPTLPPTTSPSPKSPNKETPTSPHTVQTERTQGQPQYTTSPSAQAKAHIDSPNQLNVGGNTTVVHGSPRSNPLMAGLVSAFIIAAVIITLLLFLKLRRRNNRPAFRRLQDLPMDDMMEDTPLAMYTY